MSEIKLDLESGAKPGVEKLNLLMSHKTRHTTTPLPSSRPERLESPERVFWTAVTANGHSRPPHLRTDVPVVAAFSSPVLEFTRFRLPIETCHRVMPMSFPHLEEALRRSHLSHSSQTLPIFHVLIRFFCPIFRVESNTFWIF